MDVLGIVDMVDNMNMVDKGNMVESIEMVDSIDMMNMQKSFGYLKLLVDTLVPVDLSWMPLILFVPNLPPLTLIRPDSPDSPRFAPIGLDWS